MPILTYYQQVANCVDVQCQMKVEVGEYRRYTIQYTSVQYFKPMPTLTISEGGHCSYD